MFDASKQANCERETKYAIYFQFVLSKELAYKWTALDIYVGARESIRMADGIED